MKQVVPALVFLSLATSALAVGPSGSSQLSSDGGDAVLVEKTTLPESSP